MWLGAWRKYSPVPYAATNERKVNEKLDRACKALLLEVDRTMAHRPRCVISDLDNPTACRMKFAHQPIARAAVNMVEKLQHAWVPSAKKWYQKDPTRAITKSFRMGGIGSMLAVSISTGDGRPDVVHNVGNFPRPCQATERARDKASAAVGLLRQLRRVAAASARRPGQCATVVLRTDARPTGVQQRL
jgi:hypothetical protein